MDHYAFFLIQTPSKTKARVRIPNVKKALERLQKHLLCSCLVSGFHYIKYPDYTLIHHQKKAKNLVGIENTR
jgi:hypothetical protein